MKYKLDFASRLDMAQAKAGRISEAGEQVMSFQDFSAHHSQGRLSFAVDNGLHSFLGGSLLGIHVGSESVRSGETGFLSAKACWATLKPAMFGTAAILGACAIFAPSKPERDLQGYEKYLNEKATKVFEKPTQVEMLQMGVGGLGRGV